MIQQLLIDELGYKIPGTPNPLESFDHWQLVIPTQFDTAQLLFIGRKESVEQRTTGSLQLERIPISDAQATIYIHRGATDGWSKNPRGEYKMIWLELAGIFPDSNGENRLLAVYFRTQPDYQDFSAQSMRISIRDNELIGREDESDSIFGLVLTMPTAMSYPNTYTNKGVVTDAMLDLIPGQRRVIVAPFFGYTGVSVDGQISRSSPVNDMGLPIDRGLHKVKKSGVWEIGLNSEGTRTPWTLTIPDSLEKHIPSLK